MALLTKKSRDALRLTEALIIVCPNPKCQKEIKESILLTVRSVTPPKQYEACPYCFAKIELEPTLEQEQQIIPDSTKVEQEIVEEVEEKNSKQSVDSAPEKENGSGPKFLDRVKALISKSSDTEKEKQKITEEPKDKSSQKEKKVIKEEPETEYSFTEEETKDVPEIEASAEKEKHFSGCPQTFGYLAKRPKDMPIPQQCMLCPKIVDCMLKID